MSGEAPPVLLDTNVASFLFGKRPQAELYHDVCSRRRGVLSFQTAAELRAGAALRRWGEPAVRRLEKFIGFHDVLHSTDQIVAAWARLRVATVASGRTVAAGDLWVAAVALAEDLTLVAHDKVFRLVAPLVDLKLVCRAPE